MTPERLVIFDFDGTLFRSPLKPEEWPEGKGWWGRPESLDEPCVPAYPDPDWWVPEVVEEARGAIDDPDVHAVLLTGRLKKKFTDRIDDLLAQATLDFDEVLLTHGKGGTIGFKLRALERLLEERPEIRMVTIWDDREDHVQPISELLDGAGVPYEIKLVEKASRPALCP
jgi:hypothetical protein